MRSRAEIEIDEKTRRETIIVSEIPYQLNKARLIERIAELVKEKKLEGISELRDVVFEGLDRPSKVYSKPADDG